MESADRLKLSRNLVARSTILLTLKTILLLHNPSCFKTVWKFVLQ